MYSFFCPACSTPLRVRDSDLREGIIKCPNCASPLILQVENGQVSAKINQNIDFPSGITPKQPVKFVTLFLLLGTLVAGVLVYSFSNSSTTSTASHEDVEETVSEHDTSNNNQSEQSGSEEVKAVKEPATVEGKLKKIYELVSEFRQQNSLYPNGKFLEADSNEPQHSWISELMKSEAEQRFSLSVDSPWNDPVNDAFVRRRLQLFQNQNIEKIVGVDRYPASHFAGMSGVGEDAEKLPKRHPRAGIFSPYRETTIADIIDGTANTIMVVGVESELGSWARPGQATLRSFNQEPYINGPDGIGTGLPDSMQVLMADGSVKTLSSETSPLLIRRMAAMADGLSLDLDVVGDPLSMGLHSSVDGSGQPVSNPNDPPITPLFAADIPQFDVRKSLNQKLRSYRTSQPQSLESLLREFQELVGARIDWGQLDEEKLAQEIELSLDEITLSDLLDELAERAGIKYLIEQNVIILKNPSMEK